MARTLGIAGLLLCPALVLAPPAWLATPRGLLIAGYLATVTTAGTYLAYGWGLRTTSLDTVATLLLAEPAVATLLGVAVLREPHTRWTWCGLALIGAALTTLSRAGRAAVPVAMPPSPATVTPVALPRPARPRPARAAHRRTVTVVVTRCGDGYVARCLEPDISRRGRSLAQSLEHLRVAVEGRLAAQPWADAPHPLVTSLEVRVAGCRDRSRRPARRRGSGAARCCLATGGVSRRIRPSGQRIRPR
jgi:uncharacterized membrane protein